MKTHRYVTYTNVMLPAISFSARTSAEDEQKKKSCHEDDDHDEDNAFDSSGSKQLQFAILSWCYQS